MNRRDPLLDGKISIEELKETISKSALRKAPGPDELPNELFKILPNSSLNNLLNIYNMILEKENSPESWAISGIHILYNKKENDSQNYRGIALLNNAAKLFSTIIYNNKTESPH